MCVNLKSFNESFRKWAEERDDKEEVSRQAGSATPESEEIKPLLANLDRKAMIASGGSSANDKH
jgi:hypothetical protein